MTSISQAPPILQIPPQSPGFQGVPTGGILINRVEDERVLPRRSPTDPPSPIRIAAPASGIARGRPKSVSLPPANTTTPENNGQSSSPRIRFAPLPDPAVHGRTLSTSRPDQDHVSEVRNLGPGAADNDEAVDDDDEDTDEDYDWEGDNNGRRRSWAVTMGMGSWKSSSKKLLGGGSSSKSKPASNFGAPLTKSVSQPNSVNSSPFRWTGGNDSGTASGRRGSSVGAHRRGASGDSGSFGTSPNPSVGARMLNGRVYGARRASEAALQEKINREKLEPAFVEWGAGGHGSAPVAKPVDTTGKGIDDDDGGGMAWVRRRREERERKEREEKERAEKEAAERAAAGDSAGASAAGDVGPMGESLDAEQLGDQRPASLSSSASSVSSPRPAVGPLTPRDGQAEFALPAIHISEPPSKGPAGGIDIPRGRRVYPEENKEDNEDDDDDEDDDEEEDEEDEDFPADEDEDEEEGLPDHLRRTCDAAGVEVLSRHK